jgi:cobalt/nickel transport system permease protein
MHIPDGYLSPQTCAVLGAACVPFWVVAVRRVKKLVTSRFVPLMAIAAAFSFLIMMFNVPVPDGTTAHATGAAVTAIILGPWAAVITMTIALAIQALFFGDGGVLAFGANVFNMAIVLPFVAYFLYRWIAGRSALTSGRRAWAAGIGGYIGINVAALVAATEFGLQPSLFHTANGTPLYAPFGLSQTIPAMAFAHLTVAGLAEFAFTIGIVAYLQRANIPVLRINHPDVPLTDVEVARERAEEKKGISWRWAWIPLVVMALLTPLGLLAPGGAFGEDAPEDLDLGKYGLQAIPTGLEKFASFWSHTLLGGYGFESGDHPVLGYIVSAFVGIAICGLLIFGIVYLLRALMGGRGGTPTAEAPKAAAT